MKLKMELDRIFWQNLIFWDETSFWKASIKFSVNFTNMFKVSGRSAWHCFLRQWRFRDRTTHQLKILTKKTLKNSLAMKFWVSYHFCFTKQYAHNDFKMKIMRFYFCGLHLLFSSSLSSWFSTALVPVSTTLTYPWWDLLKRGFSTQHRKIYLSAPFLAHFGKGELAQAQKHHIHLNLSRKNKKQEKNASEKS